MLVRSPLPFVVEFLEQMNEVLRQMGRASALSKGQRLWLGFCLTAMLVSNRLCWASFERLSLGRFQDGALSWMLRRSAIAWQCLLAAGVRVVVKRYGVRHGFLVVDPTQRRRSKDTTRIASAHRMDDRKTDGYLWGQQIVFVLLVTRQLTVPVGFAFYCPDPAQTAWRKQDAKLRQRGVAKRARPAAPAPNPAYPSKQALALELVQGFRSEHPDIAVDGILSDAEFLSPTFQKRCRALYPSSMVLSFLRSSQTIRTRTRRCSVQHYFRGQTFLDVTLRVRGHHDAQLAYASARVRVCSHRRRFYVLALRYPNGQTRYLASDDLTWRAQDLLRSAACRWLIEVFFEDWKMDEAWAQAAFQHGDEGSRRGLVLSLLVDISLLLCPQQAARIEHNLPAWTVGSLRDPLRAECFEQEIRTLVASPDPIGALHDFAQAITENYPLRQSSKHGTGGEHTDLGPAPSLIRKYAHEQAALNRKSVNPVSDPRRISTPAAPVMLR